ncbi:MAG TPA: NUDIX hydrolase [Streptosporangiaceae bacterium]|nr:NUDIX hydrolase [Streptosporangiaceae bacterium]
MPRPNLRPSARAIILDQDDRILLCRLEYRRSASSLVVWVPPGGGVEPGESLVDALRRELDEEVGFKLEVDPPHVWHEEVVAQDRVPGYDGIINDFFLVRTATFVPRGAMTDEELAAENVTGAAWWSLAEIAGYEGPDLFGPRDLGARLATLLSAGPPSEPIRLGL